MAKVEPKRAFYGMITYVPLSGNMEDSLVSFYDDRKRFEEEVAYQKEKNTKSYGTVLTREQFIEGIAKALDTQGHSFAIGRSLTGNYAEEVIAWKENNQMPESIHPELAELNLKAAIVYAWELASGVKSEEATTSVDIHTGQIFINSDSRFEERYAQIEAEQTRMDAALLQQDNIMVAIESTMDYTEGDFHRSLVNIETQNVDGTWGQMKDLYRIVTVKNNDNQVSLVPYDNNVFESWEAVKEWVDSNESFELVDYDEIVNEVVKQRIALEIERQERYEELYQKAPVEQADAIPAEKKISEYRGFAYMKNSKKPQIVYGNSKEEILNLLRKWNQTRTPGYTCDTCNIGQYNPEIGKHENYKKIDVATGKDISNIYLEMPKHLSKQEFQDIVKYFKENGAVFNTYKKQWYITEEIKEKGMFEKYLPGNVQENQNMQIPDSADRQEQLEPQNQEVAAALEKVSVIGHISSIDRQYVVDLKNGETLRISEGELQKTVDINSGHEVVEALEEKVREHMKLFTQEGYDISVSNESYDNRCTVWMHNGQSIDLFGDQFGVHFPSLEASKVSEIVSNYMKLQENKQEIELKEGVTTTFYVPDYTVSENGIREICGMKAVTGSIQEVTPEKYVVLEAGDKYTEVLCAEIYDKRQATIMEKAVSKNFTTEQMDLVGQPRLSAAQMEQVFNGIQDKLSIHQVVLYANPSIEAWQMDIYRYGMGNGMHFEDVKEIIQNNTMKVTSWEDSRNMVDKMVKAQRNLIIKDLKNNGLNPEKQLVRKFEKLNGMTGKMHSVEEVMKALKEKTGNLPADRKSIMREIGKEINYQKSRFAVGEQVPSR